MTDKEIQSNEIGNDNSSHFISSGMTETAQTNLIIGGTVVILLFGLFSNYLLRDYAAPVETIEGSWACTAEIKVCPDGSTVSRTPPYCQFAACPH